MHPPSASKAKLKVESSNYASARTANTTCSFCNRHGHVAEKCWDKDVPFSSAIGTVVKSAICTFCHRRGHIAPKFWDKYPCQRPAHIRLNSSKPPFCTLNHVAHAKSPSATRLSRPKNNKPVNAAKVAFVGTTVVTTTLADSTQQKPGGSETHEPKTGRLKTKELLAHGAREKRSHSMPSPQTC